MCFRLIFSVPFVFVVCAVRVQCRRVSAWKLNTNHALYAPNTAHVHTPSSVFTNSAGRTCSVFLYFSHFTFLILRRRRRFSPVLCLHLAWIPNGEMCRFVVHLIKAKVTFGWHVWRDIPTLMQRSEYGTDCTSSSRSRSGKYESMKVAVGIALL